MPPQDIEDIYPLSPLQEGMLFHSLRDPASGVFFEQESYPLHGTVDIPGLQLSWRRIVNRHSILRSSFHWEGLENPVQVVHRRVELPFEILDWRTLPSEAQQRRLATFLADDRAKGFHFSEAPLIRLRLIQLSSDVSQFVFSFHHILLDGWSHHIVMEEVWTMYDSYRAGGAGAELPSVRPYADFIDWIQHQDLFKAEAFWRRTLDGVDAPTRLGMERSGPLSFLVSPEQGEQSLRLSKRSTAELQRLAREERLTMNTLVQGAWAILLSRYSGNADVVFGAVVSGRPTGLAGVESMVGLFINTLPLRAHVLPDESPLPWLRGLQAQQFEAREYEFTPMVKIQSWTGMPAGVALFDSIVIFENYPVSEVMEDDRENDDHSYCFEKTNYPLNLMAIPGPRLSLKLLYSPAQFDHASMRRTLGHLRTVLEGLIGDAHRLIGELPLLSAQEERQILVEWNSTSSEYALEFSIPGLFEEQVRRTPHATAFVFNNETLDYEELNRRTNKLAHHLRSLGVGPESLVAICLDRSFSFIICLLGVLKAGAAYLPLDSTYPVERLQYMLADSRASVLVTSSVFASLFSDLQIPTLSLEETGEITGNDRDPDHETHPASLAYLIYTSGSTGRPKGADVEHNQILNRLHWMWKAYPFQPGEVCCQKTATSFVDSIWEVLGPLLRGVPTVIIPNELMRDPEGLIAALAQHSVTRIWTVPSWLRMMLETYTDLRQQLPHLTFWVATGETLGKDLCEQFYRQMPGCTLYNLYGTSEIWDAAWYRAPASAEFSRNVPIGRPISNVQTYVLDSYLRVQPIGVIGELYVAGVGLARCYRNLAALTAERFLPNPFARTNGERLYKTGDLARYLPDGSIEFVGRADGQVKIRGFRIELEEVEATLAQYPGVRRAAVIADEERSGDTQLIAHIIPDEDQNPAIAGLRRFVAGKLPAYMTPSGFVIVDRFPLTPSGKLDRRSLRDIGGRSIQAEKIHLAPQTALEKILANMYAEILQVDQVNIADDFFADLGGHSLLATRLVSRIRDTFDCDLPVRTVFDKPTVLSLAEALLEDPSQRPRMQRTAELMLSLAEASDEELEAGAFSDGHSAA